jgi:exodeoxyribonuclease VII small subunit
MMDLAMMGCGTGAVLEPKYTNQLPVIRNRLSVRLQGTIGSTPAEQRRDRTEVVVEGNQVTLEESMALFERGQALTQRCAALLDQAELRVRVLDGQEAEGLESGE